MALKDLKSDLSWYASNGTPAGYLPNANRASTRFASNDDSSFSVLPRGFDANGFQLSSLPLTSANEFYIDNATTSFRGTSSRLNQLGIGSQFPIGPKGQIHQFDKPRTGFHFKNKYGNIYNSLTNNGLADTYTKKSPIDDMYNKFKVREEAWNPTGTPEQPYILRGIQKNDSSDPEVWGKKGVKGSQVDLPRGGIITATRRAAIDVERMSKFLLSTKGIQWIGKQQLLHLMNTNREDSTGLVQIPIHANSSKVFQVANFLKTIAGSAGSLGKQIRSHGQSEIDTPGYLPFPPSPPSNYEDIIAQRNIGILQDGTLVDPTQDNRLVLIYRDLLNKSGTFGDSSIGIGASIPQLAARFGPTSIAFNDGEFDVQGSAVRRWSVTKPGDQQEITIGDNYGRPVTQKFVDIISDYIPYSYSKPYTDNDNILTGAYGQFIIDDRRDFKNNMLLVKGATFTKAHPIFDDVANPRLNGRPESFDAIQQGNDLRKDSKSARAKLVDFRSSRLSKNGLGNYDVDPYQPYTLIEPTGYRHSPGTVEVKENMLRNLRQDVKEGATTADGSTGQFNGRGNSNRAINDGPNDSVYVQERDPLTGKWATGQESENLDSGRTSELEYKAIGQAAYDRKEFKKTDIDFRKFGPDNEKYKPYVGGNITDGESGADELASKRIESDFDGIKNPVPLNQVQANPASHDSTLMPGNSALQIYKTMTYGEIKKVTKDRQPYLKRTYDSQASLKVLDFRNAGAEVDSGTTALNKLVNDGEILMLKFNDIEFSAYIETISDTFSPGYSSEPDQNRADPRYLYTSFERKVQVNFKVVYEFSDKPPYEKLKALADLTTPGYGGGPWGQGVFLTLGTLYNNVPMLLESLSYDWENETPWDLAGDQADKYDGLPMYTNVSAGLIYLGDVKPAKGNGYVLYGS